jgi:hypothetical protein
MEQQGTMEITNQTTKHRCVLSFKPGMKSRAGKMSYLKNIFSYFLRQ